MNLGSEKSDENAKSIHNTAGLTVFNSFSAPDNPEPKGTSRFGIVLNVQKNPNYPNPAVQLYMPWNGTGNKDYTTYPIMFRSHTDGLNWTGWTPWRRIAYYDEIEIVCRNILKSEGLIK